MRALGVICARAGSKTLPGKNIIPFNGEPLILRSVKTALRSIHLTDVVVSTDCELVKRLVGGLVEVIDRPADLARDDSPIGSAVLHALNAKEGGEDYPPDDKLYDAVVCLQNSQPFRTAEDIDRSLELLESCKGNDTVVSVVRAEQYHPNLALVKVPDGGIVRHEKNDPSVFRRQDQDPVYFMTGIVYTMWRDSFMNAQEIPCGSMYPLEIPAHRAMDIHDWRDWRIAEAIERINQ